MQQYDTADIIAVVPFLLLLLVIPTSLSFRCIKGINLSRQTRQTLNMLYAFTTEGLQLLIALSSILAIVLVYKTLSEVIGGWPTLCLALQEEYSRGWCAFVGTAFALILPGLMLWKVYSLVIYSFDVLEGRILLGTWEHPYGGKSFPITRWAIGLLRRKINTCFAGDSGDLKMPRMAVQTRMLGKKRKVLLARLVARKRRARLIKGVRHRDGKLVYLDLATQTTHNSKSRASRILRQERRKKTPSVKQSRRTASTDSASSNESWMEVYLPTPPTSEERHRASFSATLKDTGSADEPLDQNAVAQIEALPDDRRSVKDTAKCFEKSQVTSAGGEEGAQQSQED